MGWRWIVGWHPSRRHPREVNAFVMLISCENYVACQRLLAKESALPWTDSKGRHFLYKYNDSYSNSASVGPLSWCACHSWYRFVCGSRYQLKCTSCSVCPQETFLVLLTFSLFFGVSIFSPRIVYICFGAWLGKCSPCVLSRDVIGRSTFTPFVYGCSVRIVKKHRCRLYVPSRDVIGLFAFRPFWGGSS